MSRESKRELIDEVIRLAREHEAANDAFDEVVARRLGLNRTDLRCLGIVQNSGAMTAGRLAELSGLTTAAVTAVLDRVERAGYARRVRDRPDRRQVIVELTPLAAERADLIWGPLAAEATAAFARMTMEELRGVGEFFRTGIELNARHIERVGALEFE